MDMMRAMTKIMQIFLKMLTAAMMLSVPAHTAANTSYAKASHSGVKLVSEYSALQASDTLWFAVHFTPIDGWHTYWENPGDSGMATIVSWQSDHLDFGKEIYGTPTALPTGPLTNYGFEGPSTILIPSSLKPGIAVNGIRVPVKLDIEWLVCKVECIPQFATLETSVTIGGNTQASIEPAIFDTARAALPDPAFWDAELAIVGDQSQMTLFMSPEEAADITAAQFYPLDEGVLIYAAPQTFQATPAGLILGFERFAEDTTPGHGKGVVTLTSNSQGTFSVGVDAVLRISPAPILSAATDLPPAIPALGLAQAILFALGGGFLLNLMPCVFPVLSLKAFSIVSGGTGSVQARRRDGLAYTAGIIVSFAGVAGLLLSLKAAGVSVGWGFQLQNPLFVAVLVLLLFTVGLSLSGLFDFRIGIEGAGQALTEKGGSAGAFFTGILATLVATPCTAPLMAPAIGFALTQSSLVAFAIFIALGLGMALPFLALSYSDTLARRLPKPGPWMKSFKEFLAFPMYVTAAWLASVYGTLSGTAGLLPLLVAAVVVAFGLWVWGLNWRLSVRGPAALCVAALVGFLLLEGQPGDHVKALDTAITEQNFNPATLPGLIAGDKPVFLYFTADWCITCKANEKVALHRTETDTYFKRRDMVVVKGDWTNRNDDITRYLASYGRAGVPLYLYFPGGGGPAAILPQILTPSIIQDSIEQHDAERTGR